MCALSTQFECATLSDRLAFACLSLLSPRERLKAFTATWAANYGSLVTVDGQTKIRIPAPMSIQVRSQIVNVTPNWVDRILRVWREDDLWQRNGDWVVFDPKIVQDTYHWMRSLEEGNEHFPESFIELIHPAGQE